MDEQHRTITVNHITDQELQIDATKDKIKTRRETIDEHIQSKQEWLDVQAAREEMQRLQQKLAASLGNDGEYNNMLEDLGQLKDKLKSEKEILSDLIVGYAIETKETQIELNKKGDARDLVLTGRLGKKGKYQTNLFADSEGLHAGNVTISSR